MSKKVFSLVTASGLGLLGGLWLGIANKNLAQTIGFGTGGALFGGGVVAFIYDTRLNTIKNKLEASISELTVENTKLKTLLETANELKADIQNARDAALTTITELKTELTLIKSQLQQESNKSLELSEDNKRLLIRINELQDEIKELNQICNNKESELQEFSDSFSQRLDTELAQEFAAKKEQIVQEEVAKEFELTQEAFNVIEQMQSLVKEVYERHQGQRHLLLNTHGQYLDHHNKAIAKHQEAYDALLEVKDTLELRVRMLEQQLAGDLLEPVYGDFGFDINGKIANAIAYDIWQSYKIPLVVNGFDESEESVLVGYGFSKSLNIQSFLHLLVQESRNISSRLGVFQISDIKAEKTSPTITLRFRRERPKPLNDDEIYKLGLIPASQFGDRVYLHTDHKTKGKPTLRIMSATGGGKGIATKNIVAYFLTLADWEIWVSDPLHGSEEDYWHCPKVATSPSESAKAYSEFVRLHKDRQAKRPAITDRFVLGIFDEFDKQHDDDDKKTATEIMTAIRHTKQRQILIGQSGEVGANHWTWDTMKNCSMLFIEDAIGTAIKHDKDLGWSLAKKREIQRKYEKFAEWAASKNESQNLSSENAYRIGLIIIGDRYEFLEIPSAHKGILRNGTGVIRESFAQLETIKDELTKPIEQTEIECPHCHSASFVRHKTHKNPTLHNYKCKGCNRQFTARNNRIF